MIAWPRLFPRASIALAALLVSGGCASIAPPLPPALNLPLRVSDMTAVQRGAQIIVQFTMPVATTEGLPIDDTPLTEVYVGASGPVFNETAWLAGARRFTGNAGKNRIEIPITPFVGKDVAIALRLKNDRGHDAGWSNFVAIPITAALSRPVDLAAAADALGVKLTWTGTAPLYRIYRKDNTGLDFAPLGDTPTASYVDATADYGKPYQYFVQGLRKSGEKSGESEVSDTVSITAVDTFPPAVPSNVRTIVGTKTVELSWNRDTEPDLAGYRVYRAEAEGPFKLVAAALTSATYSDHDVKPGSQYRYRVLAFDQAGNASAQSEPVEARVP